MGRGGHASTGAGDAEPDATAAVSAGSALLAQSKALLERGALLQNGLR